MEQVLIIVNGKDKTDSIASWEPAGSQINIVYQNSPRVYCYNRSNVRFLPLKQRIDPASVILEAKGYVYTDVDGILDYGEFYQLERQGKKTLSFPYADVHLSKNCLGDKKAGDLFGYFKETASALSLVTGDDINILQLQYDKIKSVGEETVLASYFNPDAPLRSDTREKPLIYPFGLNQSQKQAVENAFSSQVSIIQGPPGTGKTQTILNIIANAVREGKTVAVVSNNNAATSNVSEKLEKKGLSFLTAFLGSLQNKELFLNAQTGHYPTMDGWMMDPAERENLSQTVNALTLELNSRLDDKNRIAAIEQELLNIKPEQHYFEEYYGKTGQTPGKAPNLQNLSSAQLIDLWLEYESFAERGRKPGFFRRLLLSRRFSRPAMKIFKRIPEEIIPSLQDRFYKTRIRELRSEKENLERRLKGYSFDDKMKMLSDLSMRLFKCELAQRYPWRTSRPLFEKKDFRGKSEAFNREYPVILSTTYSIKGTLSSEHIYDYLIIDEASQVDLATGVLAFSCARNIVIVGDQKQLPNVLTPEDKRIAEEIWDRHAFDERYHFTTHSLLASAAEIWAGAPSVLLREHYRCHPKIAEFFNQKFYGGKLIVMTCDHGEPGVLSMYRTKEGNHARGHLNQRQIDVVQQEVIPALLRGGHREIGIITPYREQVAAIRRQLGEQYEVATVHKFQGREKDAVILTTVDNVIGAFVDDPNLLNVAVSRAVSALAVVISDSEENKKTNYGDLARYIGYNNFQIIDSRVFSVFDLLYKTRYAQRKAYLKKKKRISEYDSENLAYSVIEDVLKRADFSQYDCAAQTELATLVRDLSALTEAERRYAGNPLTRTDFTIFNRMDKSPVLVIEIDGVSFHKEGSRQAERDAMKNSVLQKVGIPILRIRTDESQVKEKIISALKKAAE